MDLSDLIDRNAAFTPDKGRHPVSRAARSATGELAGPPLAGAARAASSPRLGVGPRRPASPFLAANHPDYLVLLYACRAGSGAMPGAAQTGRLGRGPSRVFILSDAGVKALVVEGGIRRGHLAA